MFGKADVVPMWVADMDFPTPPFIIERLEQRLKHPLLGYTIRDDEYNSAIEYWLKKRDGWIIQKEWISFCPGIVAGLNHAVQAFTKPGEKILIQTPVYHPFFFAVKQNERELVENPLLYSNNRYSIDFNHFEEQLKSGVKLFILCNPHNPVGRVWTIDELKTLAELCLKYNVLVVSDEIHSDLVLEPNRHIPFASISSKVSDITITFGSASKTFNIAGLACAYAVISKGANLKQYNLQLESNGTGLGNIFGYEALKAAYSPQGKEWLMQVMKYLSESIDLVRDYLLQNIPKIKLVEPEGTYLLWLDFNEFGYSQKELNRKLIHEIGVGFSSGDVFGSNGKGFQRMNIACPKSMIEKVLERLANGFAE
jgi:cystathionine beta-lyase